MCLVTAQGLERDSNGECQEQETEGVNREWQLDNWCHSGLLVRSQQWFEREGKTCH